ncbi:MAG TPA: GAF domain-containing protein [Candidatus Angelobacter sp.]
MNEQLQSANAVVTSVKKRLASAIKFDPATLDGVVETLTRGRGYAWTGVYLGGVSLADGMSVSQSSIYKSSIRRSSIRESSIRESLILQSMSGPAPASTTMADVDAEIAVPIKLGARTLGIVVAETGRRSAPRQDRELLRQVTKLIAQYLTANSVQRAPRKTRERLQAEPALTQKPKGPHSARPAARKAAAGEQSPR